MWIDRMHDPTERYKINPGFKIQDTSSMCRASLQVKLKQPIVNPLAKSFTLKVFLNQCNNLLFPIICGTYRFFPTHVQFLSTWARHTVTIRYAFACVNIYRNNIVCLISKGKK